MKWVNRKNGMLVKINEIDEKGNVLYRRIPTGATHKTSLKVVMADFVLAGV